MKKPRERNSLYMRIEKRVMKKYEERGRLLPQRRPTSGVLHFFGLFTGSFIGEVLSAPFERIKILAQLQNSQSFKETKTMKGLLGSLRSVINNQGRLTLFRGLSPNLYKQALLLFLSISVGNQYKYSLRDSYTVNLF